jgi:hypothetical protein
LEGRPREERVGRLQGTLQVEVKEVNKENLFFEMD